MAIAGSLRRPAIYAAALVVGVAAWAAGLPWWAALAIMLLSVIGGAALSSAVFAVATGPERGYEPRHERAPAEVTPTTSEEHIFRLEGEYWTIAFRGTTFRLHDAKGLTYIHRLLETPGVEVHVLDLVLLGGGTGRSGPIGLEDDLHADGGGADPVIDRTARAQYAARIDELRDQIEQGEANNDPEMAARARAELEFILKELAKAKPAGRPDRTFANEAERARVRVYRAIRASIERIREHNDPLAHHLDRAIRTGAYCAYEPDLSSAPEWAL
jgi:membrane protein implicated in regulation of membrane protease activity